MTVSEDVVFVGANTLPGAGSADSEAVWVSNGSTATEVAPFASQYSLYYPVIAGADVTGGLVFEAGETSNSLPSTLYATDPTTGMPVPLPATVPLPGRLIYPLDNLPASNGSVAIFADPAGNGLLRSDGTAAGTYEVPVAQAAADTTPSGLTTYTQGLAALGFYALGGTVLFEGTGRDNPTDLFRTDGTAAGTREVIALPALPDLGNGTPAEFDPLATLGGRVIFVGPGTAGIPGLWSTDGTADGTAPLALLPPIPTSDGGGFGLQSAVILGGRLVFAYDGGFYVTDGTTAGTLSLGALGATANTRNIDADEVTLIGNRVVFGVGINNPGGEDGQLWASDGTAAGTRQVAVANPGTLSSGTLAPLDPGNITSIGSLAVFSGGSTQVPDPPGNVSDAADLWATDGTAAGTVDIGAALGPIDITAFGSKALFVQDSPAHGASGDLWVTDGTAAGTIDIAPGLVAINITVAGNAAYFTGFGVNGLYVTDGTVAGTHLVPGTIGLDPTSITPVPSPLGFSGTQAQYDLAPTAAGTLQTRDLVAGRDGSVTVPDASVLTFGDGSTAVFDPSGNAGDVARLYFAAYGHAPDLAGLLDYTRQLGAGTASLAQIAAAAPASAEFLSLYGAPSDARFVTQAYENADGRAPDPGGLAGYVDVLASGQTRGQVLVAIAESPEARVHSQAVAGNANDAAVTRLYEAIDARAPDPGGLIAYGSALDAGRSVQAIAATMLAAPEYAGRFGTPSDGTFVTELYRNLLGRAPDAAGLGAYTADLAGGESRAQLVAGFIASDEARLATGLLTHQGYVSVA